MKNWQNQFAPYMPAQMTSLPGQANAPIPSYSGLPMQGMLPQPNSLPQETQIPSEVIAAAQAAGLGMPTRAYSKRSVSNNSQMAGVQSIMRITFIGTGAIMLIVTAVILFTVPAPFNWLSAGITVLCTLPFIPVFLKFTRGMSGNSGNKALMAWSCPQGLVYTQNKQLNTLRWTEVRQVWRKLGMLNGMMTTLAYVVEPANAAPFSFSLLNGPFADYVLSGNGGGSMSVSFGGGYISNNGGFVQISGHYSLTEYAGLGDLIEEQVTQCTLPRMLETYRAGNAINFGFFSLHQQGLSDGVRELAWHEIDQVQISGSAIQITKNPTSMTWFNLSAATLPNFALLCAVLNTLRKR